MISAKHFNPRSIFETGRALGGILLLTFSFFFMTGDSPARTIAAPWSNEIDFQSLVYGSASTADVVRVMGAPPDDIVRAEQMVPVIENFYYYDAEKTGAATVFVFENGLLAGLQYKTPGNQFIDLSYFLTDNGDRGLNMPMLGGYSPYFSRFPFVSW